MVSFAQAAYGRPMIGSEPKPVCLTGSLGSKLCRYPLDHETARRHWRMEPRLGFSTSKPVDSTPNPVVTTLALAGFAFSLLERFSGLGLGLTVWVGFVAS